MSLNGNQLVESAEKLFPTDYLMFKTFLELAHVDFEYNTTSRGDRQIKILNNPRSLSAKRWDIGCSTWSFNGDGRLIKIHNDFDHSEFQKKIGMPMGEARRLTDINVKRLKR